jgi:hypothetical protein
MNWLPYGENFPPPHGLGAEKSLFDLSG